MIDELKAVVRRHESSRPRSMQTAIGPSEVGTPCARRLAYKILGVPAVNSDSDPWAAIVGTSVHAWLDDAFRDENERLGRERWLTSTRVDLPGYLSGSIDLYDADETTVWDHKVPGKASYDRMKKSGPGEQYRTQLHVYGAGMRLLGHHVSTVGLVIWSRTGRMRDHFTWSEPYDEDVVEVALTRLDAIRSTTAALGLAALPLIPTADAYCLFCPNYLPGVTDAEEACSGFAAGAITAPTQGVTP